MSHFDLGGLPVPGRQALPAIETDDTVQMAQVVKGFAEEGYTLCVVLTTDDDVEHPVFELEVQGPLPAVVRAADGAVTGLRALLRPS